MDGIKEVFWYCWPLEVILHCKSHLLRHTHAHSVLLSPEKVPQCFSDNLWHLHADKHIAGNVGSLSWQSGQGKLEIKLLTLWLTLYHFKAAVGKSHQCCYLVEVYSRATDPSVILNIEVCAGVFTQALNLLSLSVLLLQLLSWHCLLVYLGNQYIRDTNKDLFIFCYGL